MFNAQKFLRIEKKSRNISCETIKYVDTLEHVCMTDWVSVTEAIDFYLFIYNFFLPLPRSKSILIDSLSFTVWSRFLLCQMHFKVAQLPKWKRRRIRKMKIAKHSLCIKIGLFRGFCNRSTVLITHGAPHLITRSHIHTIGKTMTFWFAFCRRGSWRGKWQTFLFLFYS